LTFLPTNSDTFELTATRDMRLTKRSAPDLPPIDTTILQPSGPNLRRAGNQFIAATQAGQIVTLPDADPLDVGHDLALNPGDGEVSGDASAVLAPELTLTRAITVTFFDSGDAKTSSGKTWHLLDSVGRYYACDTQDGWRTWPDQQDFTALYRGLAATAPSALFTPTTQATSLTGDADTTLLGRATTAAQISFDRASPYANYNWELFLHVPLAIADRLASHQRFADARQWLHGVLDPTTSDMSRGIPQYWRFLRFGNGTLPDTIAKRLEWLAKPDRTDAKDTQDVEEDFTAQILDWQKAPFMPHSIARLRPSAYQWYAFLAYIELLIAWGDDLFRRDTRESVNDATVLYAFAAKLLGPRPRAIPKSPAPTPGTYRSLKASSLDMLANAWVQYADVPAVKQAHATISESQHPAAAVDWRYTGIGQSG
jgi:hypothetical protein